tara:strand:- start:1095 stop:1223 length:129 start_codon:yes stop_codon:yes gene_type:complete
VARPHATLEKNREEHVGGAHPKKRKINLAQITKKITYTYEVS